MKFSLLLLILLTGCAAHEPVIWFSDLYLYQFDEKATEVLARCNDGSGLWKMTHRDWLEWRAVSAGIKKGDAETLNAKVLFGVNELERTCKN